MNPITREEQYLNRLTGEEGIIPDKPVTREEQYFARLCGGDNVIPDKPVTRREQYLATLCGEDVITPTKPVTRIEQYMAFASGESESKPEKPITREEMYWDKYQGGDVPEEKTIAFTDIITVTDALARPAVDLQSEITATQNLNGYEYPWVGGAGTNVFYHEGNLSRTLNGLTATFDGATQTISIEGTNTGTSAYILLDIPCTGEIPRETPLSRAIFNAPNGVYSNFVYRQNGGWYAVVNGGTIPVDADIISMQIGILTSVTTLNATGIRVQIQRGSTAPSAWTPYENICPISGRTKVEVTRTGNEPYEGDTFNTELGRTVYGGTLDLTTGELKITHAYDNMGNLTWTMSAPHIFGVYINQKKPNPTNYITTSYRTVDKAYTDLANGETTSITTYTHGLPRTFIHVRDERATTAEDFTTLVTEQKIVYELATPQTISLTPTEVMMLENNNTIWADAGRVQLTYLSKAAQRVQSMNASLRANTLALKGVRS